MHGTTGDQGLSRRYILIDYENLQPTDLEFLQEDTDRIIVFLGPHQSRISVAFATALQVFGKQAEYVILEQSGRNALDFHIAYYLGALTSRDPAGLFYVVSRDTGFDPLIRHVSRRALNAQRVTSIRELTRVHPAATTAMTPILQTVLADLRRRKSSRPRTEKTLLNTLGAVLKRESSDEPPEVLLKALCENGVVKIEGKKVHYDLDGTGTLGALE